LGSCPEPLNGSDEEVAEAEVRAESARSCRREDSCPHSDRDVGAELLDLANVSAVDPWHEGQEGKEEADVKDRRERRDPDDIDDHLLMRDPDEIVVEQIRGEAEQHQRHPFMACDEDRGGDHKELDAKAGHFHRRVR